MPSWDPQNLTNHHQKRISKDKGCFEDLMGINGRDMSEAEYEQRSQEAVAKSWAEYEGEGRHVAASAYYPPAAYFVDDDLVVAISDTLRNTFQTCYHEHFSRPHGLVPGPSASLAQRQLRYRQKLQWDENGGLIRNLRRIRGV
jgi:hypothetical protein